MNSTIENLSISGCDLITTWENESTLGNIIISNCKSEKFQCNFRNASIKTLTLDNCRLANIEFGHISERLIIKNCDLLFSDELTDLGNIYIELIDVFYKNRNITLSGPLEEVINELRNY